MLHLASGEDFLGAFFDFFCWLFSAGERALCLFGCLGCFYSFNAYPVSRNDLFLIFIKSEIEKD
jgi:hypothetical protein